MANATTMTTAPLTPPDIKVQKEVLSYLNSLIDHTDRTDETAKDLAKSYSRHCIAEDRRLPWVANRRHTRHTSEHVFFSTSPSQTLEDELQARQEKAKEICALVEEMVTVMEEELAEYLKENQGKKGAGKKNQGNKGKGKKGQGKKCQDNQGPGKEYVGLMEDIAKLKRRCRHTFSFETAGSSPSN